MSSRLELDVNEVYHNPTAQYRLSFPSGSYYHLQVEINGPENTPYAGGRFVVSIINLENYPNTLPYIKFETPIYHPNIIQNTFEFSRGLYYSKWTTLNTIKQLIELILTILKTPYIDINAIDPEVAQMYNYNNQNFLSIAKHWAQHYAGAPIVVQPPMVHYEVPVTHFQTPVTHFETNVTHFETTVTHSETSVTNFETPVTNFETPETNF